MQEYEPSISLEEAERVLSELKEELIPLVEKLSDNTPRPRWMDAKIDEKKQIEFLKRLTEELGYDYRLGRLDIAVHPFTGGYGRITTRFSDSWVSSLLITVHEAGHGMYDHGLKKEYIGRPLGSFATYSVHESQSRFWELLIARSKEFWNVYYDEMKEAYAPTLEGVSKEEFYTELNRIANTPLRVFADEVTYGLHIIIRFEIEKELLSKELDVNDVPKAWNDKVEKYLGIRPSDDAQGCLQDVHWSFGGFGYFPTYIYGSLFAAQLFEAMNKDFDVHAEVEKKNFSKIKGWLRERIHQHGKKYTFSELAMNTCGEKLNSRAFIRYIEDKYLKED